MRPDYLFHELADLAARGYAGRCHGESAVVQYQLPDARWCEPLEAMLDWLPKATATS